MADKHPHIPGRASHRPGSAPLPHPDVRGSYTRVCTSSTPGCPWLLHPGLKQLFKPFLAKEKLVLMKNEAILTCFAPIPGRSLFLLYN